MLQNTQNEVARLLPTTFGRRNKNYNLVQTLMAYLLYTLLTTGYCKNKIMETIKKCKITRYDETIKSPPYLTIKIDKMEVKEPKKDNLGEEFCERLRYECKAKGYQFKFYTTSEDKDYDYEVVVY